jgi:uncharacterized membrane protein
MRNIPVAISLFVPLLIAALSIPPTFQRIPRNHFYGFRTRRIMASDAIWHRANRIGGIGLLIASVAWFVVALILPRVIGSPVSAFRDANLIGAAFILISCFASLALV